MKSGNLTGWMDEVGRLKGRLARLESALEASLPNFDPLALPKTEIGRVNAIKQAVADAYGVSTAAFTTQRKPADIAWARQVAMALCRELTAMSFAQIGEAFGNRDHGTVFHAVAKVADRAQCDPRQARLIREIKEKLSVIFGDLSTTDSPVS